MYSSYYMFANLKSYHHGYSLLGGYRNGELKWAVRRSSDNWPRLLFLTQSRLRVLFSFPHTDGGEEFRMAPCAFVADLEDFVLSLLENRRYA